MRQKDGKCRKGGMDTICNWIFREQKREIKAEAVFEGITTVSLPKPMKDIKAQIQEALWIPSRIKSAKL